MSAAPSFPLVDRYLGVLLDVDLASVTPGETAIVESQRRLRPEGSYAYVHALWWLWLEDGRSVVSVPPGAADGVRRDMEGQAIDEVWQATGRLALARSALDPILRGAGLAPASRIVLSLLLACNARLLRRHRHGDCRRLAGAGIPAAEGLTLPIHCFPDGIVYGVIADGRVASVAYAHRTGLMEDQVADLGAETAPAYRRRAYAQTAVSAVVHHITRLGGEACYSLSPGNAASLATARSVGFAPYARVLALACPLPAGGL